MGVSGSFTCTGEVKCSNTIYVYAHSQAYLRTIAFLEAETIFLCREGGKFGETVSTQNCRDCVASDGSDDSDAKKEGGMYLIQHS